MALYSMTGFGRAEMSAKNGYRISVELSTVNRKQFDCNVALPRELAGFDAKVQSCVGSYIKRGFVKGAINIERLGGNEQEIDSTGIEKQVEFLRKLAAKLELEDDLRATALLRLPEIFRQCSALVNLDELWPQVETTLNRALRKLKTMRRAEGRALEKDLRCRFKALRAIARKIGKIAPAVPVHYKKILQTRLEKLLDSKVEIDREQIAREVAVFADRCDVSEELTRLTSHFEQAESHLCGGGVCGRTLDFICQEMFREINTTASKANDAAISKLVIDFKSKLESVREQVQNIE